LLRECAQISGLAEGIWLIPLYSSSHVEEGRTSTCGRFAGKDGKIHVQHMTSQRKLWCVAILIVRAFLLVFLAVTGTLFLVFTLDLRELLLNCAALEIVLMLDELLFTALAPHNCRKVMALLSPLPRKARKYVMGGMEVHALVTCAFLLILAGIITPLFMQWVLVDTLTCSREAMCGGRQGFLIALDPAGAVTASLANGRQGAGASLANGSQGAGAEVFTPPSARCMQLIDQDLAKSYRYRAVMELITQPSALAANVETSLSDVAAPIDWGYLSLQNRVTIPLADRLRDLNPKCVDFTEGTTIWPRNFLQDMVSDAVGVPSEGFTCSSAASQCGLDSEAGVRLRQWCPVSCGCSSPNSSLGLNGAASGCPPTCTLQPSYKEALQSARCKDHPKDSPAFQAYVTGIRDMMRSYNGSWAEKFHEWSEELSKRGCEFHDLGGFGDLCNDNVFKLKPMMHVCPVTCACRSAPRMPKGQPPLCPSSCSNSTLV